MKLKAAVLSILGREDLKAFLEHWEIEGVDKRSAEAMRAALSRSRKVDVGIILDSIREEAVKEVCDLLGVDRTGRKSVLVERLLAAAGATGGGQIVLAQYRGSADPDTGGAYTVKRYESEKVHEAGGAWRHGRIVLKPENPDFAPIEVPEADVESFRIVATFVGILRGA